jgi:glycosyltransferase involved in cell wall biosynthesis
MSTVSVVIPAYNRAHSIGAAVRSALAPVAAEIEIVVVDDGSTDDLAGALAPFGDAVRIVRHDRNRGASAARNTGIGAARGRYVALLDSDDVWLPGKIERQLSHLVSGNHRATCTGFALADAPGDPPVDAVRPYTDELGLDDVVWGCFVSPGTTLMAERDLLLAVGGYAEDLRRYEDWDLLLRLARTGERVGILGERLAVVHPARRPGLDVVRRSIDAMRERHLPWLADERPDLVRRFRSALHFELASASAHNRAIGGIAVHLALAAALAPRGNWPFQVVLSARLGAAFRVLTGRLRSESLR